MTAGCLRRRALPLLALALALRTRADAACTRDTTALTSECGGLCYDGRPCVAFADADAALCGVSASTFGTCVSDADSGCAFECFTNGPTDFVANGVVDFSDYTFFLTLDAAASSSSSSDAENDTDTHPSASASVVTSIEPLALRNTTTQVVIAGGMSVVGARDQVATVSLAAQLLLDDVDLEAVTLANLAIGDAALPSGTFPPQLTALALPNCQLADYPVDLPLLEQLEDLDLSENDLKTVPAAFGSSTLRALNLSFNAIADFAAGASNLSNLTVLDLAGNALTAIPTQVFELQSLRALNLTGNPFADVALTSEQVTFLKSLGAFSIDSFGGVSHCASSQQTNVSGVAVCLTAITSDSDSSNNGTDTTSSSSSSSSSGGGSTAAIVGGVVGGLAAVAIVCGAFLLRRKRKEKEVVYGHPDDHEPHDSKTMGETTTHGTTGGTSHAAHSSNQHPSSSSRSSHPRDMSSGTGGSLWTDQELLSLQVNLDDIRDVRKIGAGAFCVVYLATYRSTKYVASKRLKRDEVSWSNTQRFLEEIKLVSKLDHPRVVKLVGVAWSIEADLQALFEYMENGDLRSHLERTAHGDRSWWPTHAEEQQREGNKLQMAIDIAEALVYVHSFSPPLVHRDLKSRNVLLDGEMNAHVSDFGVARYKSADATMTQGVGTGRWLAPEVISGASDYDQSCDIFSFGVVLAEMDTHALPYDDVRGPGGHKVADVAVLQLVAAGRLLPSFSRECPPRVRELALRCMAYNRSERPSAVEIAYALRSLQKSVELSSGSYVV